MKLTALLIAIEVGGTVAFAMSGLIEAMRKRMDVVGVFSVAFVTAFGGGTVRDLLLDRRPLFWVEHEAYLWLVFAMVVSAPWWLKAALKDAGARLMEWADAFGLGLFAISGTSIAAAAGMSPGVSVLMGATTAIVGGVARDVLCNEVPKVYRDHRPYALCAVVGSLAFLALAALGLGSELASAVGISVATGSRLLAIAFDWQLPGWRLPEKSKTPVRASLSGVGLFQEPTLRPVRSPAHSCRTGCGRRRRCPHGPPTASTWC